MVELENAQSIAVDFVKEKKNVKDVTVIITEQKDGVWIVKGTCPVDLCGHPWRESFEVEIDQKGKIKTSSFKLM
ncbi:MAG: hypothetical protein OEY24_04470 [Candidatus Bathyarchaeota archaeon]|nr:hypothetical protein [Candidatus Bathyarchaeota archaeon]MDH5494935.1 hypothetical protein [Candidatus Bathyarchaeota archaeon]